MTVNRVIMIHVWVWMWAWCGDTYLAGGHGDLVHDLAGGELDGLAERDDVGNHRDALDIWQPRVQSQSVAVMSVL